MLAACPTREMWKTFGTYHVTGTMDTEKIRDGQVEADSMAARVSYHTFWQASRTAGVNNIDGIRRLDGYAPGPLITGTGAFNQVLPLSFTLQLPSGPPKELFALPTRC